MPLFGAKRPQQIAHDDALVHGIAIWRDMAGLTDPVAADRAHRLGTAMRLGQIAFERAGGAELLTASHLVAASLPCSSSAPSDPVVRFAGLAAVVIGQSGGEMGLTPPIADWFRRIRGRLRGSVFVPRDVEYAFAGHYEALQRSALDPAYFANTRKLLDSAVNDSLMWAAMRIVETDPTFRNANADVRQRQASKLLPTIASLPWRQEDLASLREVTSAVQPRAIATGGGSIR